MKDRTCRSSNMERASCVQVRGKQCDTSWLFKSEAMGCTCVRDLSWGIGSHKYGGGKVPRSARWVSKLESQESCWWYNNRLSPKAWEPWEPLGSSCPGASGLGPRKADIPFLFQRQEKVVPVQRQPCRRHYFLLTGGWAFMFSWSNYTC